MWYIAIATGGVCTPHFRATIGASNSEVVWADVQEDIRTLTHTAHGFILSTITSISVANLEYVHKQVTWL